MKNRIDPLIAERAPWLFRGDPVSAAAKAALTGILGYGRTVALAEQFRDRPTDEIMATLGRMFAREVAATGLRNIPAHGPALIVSTHPTGIADGIVLHRLLRQVRSDLFIYANSDILRVLPQFESLIVPVEWRHDRRSHAKTRATMARTRAALAEGRLGLIFPSGRLAKRRGLSLHERPWMASTAAIARKFDLPVIPIHIAARNSALFYLFDLIHPTMRDITLFHEVLNKARQPYRVRIGAPIPAAALPPRSEDAIAALRRATLALGEDPMRPARLAGFTRARRPA